MLLDTRITQKQEILCSLEMYTGHCRKLVENERLLEETVLQQRGWVEEKGDVCVTGQVEKGTPSTISSTGSSYTQSVESVIVPDGEVCNTITLCTTLCPYKVSSCPHRGMCILQQVDTSCAVLF